MLRRLADEFHLQIPWPTHGLRLSVPDLRALHFISPLHFSCKFSFFCVCSDAETDKYSVNIKLSITAK